MPKFFAKFEKEKTLAPLNFETSDVVDFYLCPNPLKVVVLDKTVVLFFLKSSTKRDHISSRHIVIFTAPASTASRNVSAMTFLWESFHPKQFFLR